LREFRTLRDLDEVTGRLIARCKPWQTSGKREALGWPDLHLADLCVEANAATCRSTAADGSCDSNNSDQVRTTPSWRCCLESQSGILLFSGAARGIGGRLPPGLHMTDVLIVGIAGAVGFTMSLFFATAAFPEGAALAETKWALS
jgi:hypothetical protein